MSTLTTADPPQPAASPAPPKRDPRLPIVAFRRGKSPLAVYYSTVDAAQGKTDSPRDAFFDMNGAALTLVEAWDGTPTLAAGKAVNIATLKQRLMAALRKSAEYGYPGVGLPTEVEAILTWLSAAPTFEDVVQGLGLAPTYPHPIEHHGHKPRNRKCKNCTHKERLAWGVPPCCPG